MARTMQDMNIAVLRTIDKISARTRTFEVPIDKTVKFGNSLFIRLRACRKSSPLDLPESAAFLQIWEKKSTDYKSKWIFSGWMFASNPSLSAMDHPVYDVWVIDCKNETTSANPKDFTSEKAPEGAPVKSEPAPTASTPTPETPKSDTPKSDTPKADAPKSDDEPAKSDDDPDTGSDDH